jgi:hypothetical protein
MLYVIFTIIITQSIICFICTVDLPYPGHWFYAVQDSGFTLSRPVATLPMLLFLSCPGSWFYPVQAHGSINGSTLSMPARPVLPCPGTTFYPVQTQRSTLSRAVPHCPGTWFLPVQAYGFAISRHGSTLFRPWFYSVQVRGFTLSRNMVPPSPGLLFSPLHAHGSALFEALGSILSRHMVHLWPGPWFNSVQGRDRCSTLSRHKVLIVQALGSTLSRPTVLSSASRNVVLPLSRTWFYPVQVHGFTLSCPTSRKSVFHPVSFHLPECWIKEPLLPSETCIAVHLCSIAMTARPQQAASTMSSLPITWQF